MWATLIVFWACLLYTSSPAVVKVTAEKPDGSAVTFDATVRIDTPTEGRYYENGGILQYVLRDLIKG